MDEIIGILVFLVWMVFNIVSAINKRNKEQGKKPAVPSKRTVTPRQEEATRIPEPAKEKDTSFEDMIREIRKNAQDRRDREAQENKKAMRDVYEKGKKRERAEEEEKARKYRAFVEEQRKTGHVAEKHELERRIKAPDRKYTKRREGIDFDVDLRTLVLSEVVLKRKYK